MLTEIDLSNQTALVTGAGGGLGRSHALELARRGASVVVNDVMSEAGPSGPGARAVAEEIRRHGGRSAVAIASVADPLAGQAIVDQAIDAFGSLDIVVHNAGNWRNVAFEAMTAENLDPVLDVHLRGGFFVARPAWVLMKAKGYGRVILTGSGAGMFGRENGANYVSAKAGLYGLTRALAIEGANYDIKANCVLPLALTETNSVYLAAAQRQEPERVSPLVALLASRQCPVSGEAFSAGLGGHVSRVFVGVTVGWRTGGSIPTAEEILAHFEEIEDQNGYQVPLSVIEQMQSLSDGVSGEIV